MITCHIVGGLGNQLFQIFTIIAYSLKFKKPFYFVEYNESHGITKRPTYWTNFLQSLAFSLKYSFLKSVILREKAFHYHELIEVKEENILLCGYFQSYKYFDAYYDSICKLLLLNQQKKLVQEKINLKLDNFISIHFRIGDYIHIQDCHPLLEYSYYKKSIQYILSRLNSKEEKFICFFESKDIQYVSPFIEQLKSEFSQCSI